MYNVSCIQYLHKNSQTGHVRDDRLKMYKQFGTQLISIQPAHVYSSIKYVYMYMSQQKPSYETVNTATVLLGINGTILPIYIGTRETQIAKKQL